MNEITERIRKERKLKDKEIVFLLVGTGFFLFNSMILASVLIPLNLIKKK